jgi:membrane protein required for colicin V production
MWYDVAVLAVLGYSVFRGARKGIVWQLAVIGSIILCFAFAQSFSVAMAPFFAVEPPLDRWLAMLVLYVVFSFLSFAVARKLRGWIEAAKFEEYDRHLGAVFGLVKGVMFCLVMTFFTVTLSGRFPGLREQVFDSYSGKAAAVAMDRLHPIMPAELHDVLAPYIHSLDRPGLDLRHADDHDYDGHHDYDGDTPDLDHDERERDDFARGDFGRDDTFAKPVSGRTRDLDRPAPPANAGWGPSDDPFDRREPFDSGTGAGTVRPASGSRPVDGQGGTTQRGVARWRPMLEEIESVFHDEPRTRAEKVAEFERLMSGLPDAVKAAVVEDWYTDIFYPSRERDPDPQTDISTTLDERIVRELERGGVPLSTLSSALRDRLQGLLRR